MRKICIQISYEGTSFAGWQRQPQDVTVQGEIEAALTQICNQPIQIIGSGRTDAGVHARCQVASFELHDNDIFPDKLVSGCNALLPSQIRILTAQEVDVDFHAIKSAKSKKYRYFFCHNDIPNVFLQRYVWQVFSAYDLPKMKNAAEMLVGTHDFKCLATHGVTTNTTQRTIYSIDFGQMYNEIDFVEIHANGFLRHMVRVMMGTLMEVGQGKREARAISQMISSKDRQQAGVTAPAHGLFLWEVLYE